MRLPIWNVAQLEPNDRQHDCLAKPLARFCAGKDGGGDGGSRRASMRSRAARGAPCGRVGRAFSSRDPARGARRTAPRQCRDSWRGRAGRPGRAAQAASERGDSPGRAEGSGPSRRPLRARASRTAATALISNRASSGSRTAASSVPSERSSASRTTSGCTPNRRSPPYAASGLPRPPRSRLLTRLRSSGGRSMSGMTVGSAAGVQSTPRASMPLPDAGAKSQPPAPRERVGV